MDDNFIIDFIDCIIVLLYKVASPTACSQLLLFLTVMLLYSNI